MEPTNSPSVPPDPPASLTSLPGGEGSENPPATGAGPLKGWLPVLEALLREPEQVMTGLSGRSAGKTLALLIAITAAGSAVYGFVTGTFSGGMQLWAAPVKLAGGMMASALICLPSLFIFATLGGSTARLVETTGILAGALGLTTILLTGFAPIVWVFSQGTDSLVWMAVLHLCFWLIALTFGLRFLHMAFARLVRARSGLAIWSFIYILVALQMTASLRPLLGRAETFFPKEKEFFLTHWISTLVEEVGARPGPVRALE